MAKLGALLGNIDVHGYLKVQGALRDLYEAMTGNETLTGTDGIEYAEFVRDHIQDWIDLMQEDVVIEEVAGPKGYGPYLARA